MSDGYNSRLTKGIWKGKCGMPEYLSNPEIIESETTKLADLIQNSNHFIVHTGAGISTASGIPDFRGPNGIWTCEEQEKEAPEGKPLDVAQPSFTHHALKLLLDLGFLKYIVTQNIDSLHSKSGIPEENISELHGCCALEICEKCNKRFRRNFDLKQVGCKPTGNFCDPDCGGKLRDQCLDWNQELPEPEFGNAIIHSRKADLSLCLGTSLQIRPAGQLPLRSIRRNGKPRAGKLAVVNLQGTPLDNKSHVRIFGYCDQVMEKVLQKMKIEIPSSFPEVNCQSTRNMIKQKADEEKKNDNISGDKNQNDKKKEEEEEEKKIKNLCKKRKHDNDEECFVHIPRKKIKLKKDEN